MGFKKITKKGEEFMYSIADKNGVDGLIKGKNNYEIPFVNDVNNRNITLEANIINNNGIQITNNIEYIDYLIYLYNFYGEMYDLDANILSAQAFAESGFKTWNYADYNSTAMGISQFLIGTIYEVIVKNRFISKPYFTDEEINKIIYNINKPFIRSSYQVGSDRYISQNSRFFIPRENRFQLLQNAMNNPDLMIKAQCRYMKYIANRNYNLASNTLFAYNRGSSYKSDSYVGIINKVKNDQGGKYIVEGVEYVEKIFAVLADEYNEVSIIKPINRYYGYNLDLDKNKFDAYKANIPILNSLNKHRILFILDRAHGIDVEDRVINGFAEWLYSERVVNRLADILDRTDIPYIKNVTENYEIGLTNRVERANQFSMGVTTPILLSFHNNAGGGTGNELFLQKNPTEREIQIGNIFAKHLINDFPNQVWRQLNSNLYKEENFTVLAGTEKVQPKYSGVLIEFLFMDNLADRLLLDNDKILEDYVNSIYSAILEVIRSFGYSNN
jgi:N-acetylmuramoyl-L-alanine amidase